MSRKIFEIIFITSNNLNPELIFEYPELEVDKKIFIVKFPSFFANSNPNYSQLLNPNGMKFDEYLNINFGKIIKRCNPDLEDLFLIRNDIDELSINLQLVENLIKSNPIFFVYDKGKILNSQTELRYTMGPTIFSFSQYLQSNARIKEIFTLSDEIRTTDMNLITLKKTTKSDNKQGYKTIDCFVFNNELDLLESRLKTLNNHVNKFVIVESNKTHSGESKPLFFENNKERFSEYSGKIKHIIVDSMPENMIYTPSETDVDPELHIHWFRENFQRNEILRGLYDLNLKPEDVILISDLDEIPDPSKLDFFIDSIPDGDYIFQLQKWYCWDLNHKYSGVWPGTAAVRWKDLLKTTPQEIRKNRYDKSKLIMENILGWHCSWFGGVDAIMWKLQSFAHQELRNISREDIEKKITMNLDVHGQQIFSNDDGYDPPFK